MRGWAAALLACGMAVAPVADAVAGEQEPGQTPRELLDDATEKMMQALRLMLMAVPQYALPEINDNGDIIIRRIRPDEGRQVPSPEATPDGPLRTKI